MEKDKWDDVASDLQDNKFELSHHWSFNFRNDPKRLGFVLSRYKFATKMIGKNKSIFELGCSEGIGAAILAENATKYLGIDLDQDAIMNAKKNLTTPKFEFIYDDFIKKKYGKFQAVISLDVVEHIPEEKEILYFETIMENLSEDGICVIGTPNITASNYASEASKIGHINLFSQERLVENLRKYFFQVFPFGMNDEILHTGFSSMSHYLLCLACHKKD
jgi:2-polyprenyl-3-methyl-5-hydroxy-6-metoxy-1,4-benzoquinol methylase